MQQIYVKENKMTNKIYKVSGVIIIIAAFYFISLYMVQDSLLFYPDKDYISPNNAGTSDFKEYPLVMPDGQMVMSWYAKGNTNKPLILFFHGNAGQIATFAPLMDLYHQQGYSVLMPEYRGFATTGGKRSEDTMLADAIWAYDYAKQKLGYETIIAYGYSMGSGVASGLSQYRALDGLILAAPFSSLRSLVKEKPIPFASKVLKTNFYSDRAVSIFTKPALIIHGKNDRLIPPHHGEKLFDLMPSADKTLELLAGQDHYDLYFNNANHQRVIDWLEERFY